MLPFLFTTLVLVFIFYFRTIFYEVKLFDEITPFKETYLPACFSLSEMFELISLLGLAQHFEATNTLYSNIVSLRCNPFGNFFQMFIQILFKKSPVSYHAYSLCLHLINSAFVFLIINLINKQLFTSQYQKAKKTHLLITSVLTLCWSLHPANIESVLLLTNANIVLSYTLCFIVFYIVISHSITVCHSQLDWESRQESSQIWIPAFAGMTSPGKINTLPSIPFWKSTLLFLLYLFALFLAEFHFLLPLILMAYLITVAPNNALLNHIAKSVKLLVPLILADLIYILSFIFSTTGTNLRTNLQADLLLERIFWLAPQVIFHFFKLLLFPIKLSVDQALLVTFGKSLFDTYALGCILFLIAILFFTLVSILKKRKQPLFFILFFPTIISLLPFSHVFAPLYNLASERYLYFPSFIFILGISILVFYLIKDKQRVFITLLVIITAVTSTYSIRSYIRTIDWKNSFSLYFSAIEATDNPLNKAFRYKGLTPQNKIHVRFPEHYVDKEYLKLAIENLELALTNLKIEKNNYQHKIPKIIKAYGLDPDSLIAKTGYYLAQTTFTLTKDNKKVLELIQPFTKDLSKLDSASLSFYAAVLFYNNKYSESEEILRKALELRPYSTRIIFPLCDLIYANTKDIQEIETLVLRAFQYFPYDAYTLFALTKTYKEKKDFEKYAYYSYIYGLRHHSKEDLEISMKIYNFLNKKEKALKAKKRMEDLEKFLNA